jgi:hypothetical protein
MLQPLHVVAWDRYPGSSMPCSACQQCCQAAPYSTRPRNSAPLRRPCNCEREMQAVLPVHLSTGYVPIHPCHQVTTRVMVLGLCGVVWCTCGHPVANRVSDNAGILMVSRRQSTGI